MTEVHDGPERLMSPAVSVDWEAAGDYTDIRHERSGDGVAMVAGYAVGGGQILHLVCDLTIAADNARFGQTGPRVGSWDGGYGASLLRDLVGPKKAKEFWFLCRQYDAEQALGMGLVNAVVPLERLEEETVAWCHEMLALSPFALRLPEAPVSVADRPSAARIWLMAARPRTLPAAVAPVLVGTALAATGGTFKVLTFLAALIGALFIQVGTNLSNDYSDARRGADTEDRLGPVRVTAGGLVPPRQVLIATYVAFAVAVLAGSYLIATARWELLLVGAASILAGVLYTGGPRPYGYEGLGEVFVFLFFGVVAVAGSYYAQVEALDWEALALAVPVGLLASAILVVNNVRDLETDRRAGKRTLAVRLGRPRARTLFTVMVLAAFLCAPVPWLAGSDELSAWLLLPLLAVPLAIPIVRTVRTRTDGPSLNQALAG